LKENENAEINGTIVQLFEPRTYNACVECNKKTEFVNGVYVCNEHGNTIIKEIPIANLVLDDGTESIRVVCFREVAHKLLENKISVIKENPAEFDNLKKTVLGKQVKISGRVTKNLMFDRLEFSAQTIEDLNPELLIQELKKEN
jgi:DNA/RNA endonuclease YhcR with UshA esterase domain